MNSRGGIMSPVFIAELVSGGRTPPLQVFNHGNEKVVVR